MNVGSDLSREQRITLWSIVVAELSISKESRIQIESRDDAQHKGSIAQEQVLASLIELIRSTEY
jgi:hypothetical protein